MGAAGEPQSAPPSGRDAAQSVSDAPDQVTGICHQSRCRRGYSTAMRPRCCRPSARSHPGNSTGPRPCRNWFRGYNRALPAGGRNVRFRRKASSRPAECKRASGSHRLPSRLSSEYGLPWCDRPSRSCSPGCSHTRCQLAANNSIRRRRNPDSRALSQDPLRTSCHPGASRTRADPCGIPRVRRRTNTERQQRSR